ncbi:uracil-DNA glycosylase [Salipiger sp. IMCC34102]|uniref:uracil-DNA glycosylase n=1 Tax=Salipiger sp. IMCC34102 TaxID=2510647 RepID=UPI00101B7634|nr:uracil-DNA glycosylase [Salipiger sp. IMCC34102]RYH03028.1 uracil-DNA glycosylase [Salipiger sp. IMCC34102]
MSPTPEGLDGWADLPFWQEDWPRIKAALAAETRPVFPPPARMFEALRRCPPEAVRVVILGQDPYHTPGKADGLAFSIPRGFGGRLDSLGNIFKELRADLEVTREVTSLDDWADQGVLLLNTALSVPQGAAKAHARLGWDALVRQVIARLEDRPRAFLLWGGPAQKFAPQAAHHLVLTAAHPSPLSAHRGFFGSRPFSTVNRWLTTRGILPIDWTDPDEPEHP